METNLCLGIVQGVAFRLFVSRIACLPSHIHAWHASAIRALCVEILLGLGSGSLVVPWSAMI